MGRLIDADAIVEYVRKYSPISDGADLLETWLEYAPTVDAVPVRCKDCKYWKTGEGVNRSKKVKFCTYNIGHHYARRDGDFCSRGERKDGDRHV